MKLAVISDIHGNHLGLRAVLEKIKALKIKRILILGDFVGYYYWPEIVINELCNFNYIAIKGNHEDILKNYLIDREYRNRINIKYGNGIDFAIKKIKKKDLDWLINLPEKKELKISGNNFLLCHGAPWDKNEYVYPNKFGKFRRKYLNLPFKWILQGHTHYPMIKVLPNSIVLNPGSVGQPRDGSVGAQWAMIDTKNNIAEQFCEKYDNSKIISKVKEINPELPYLANILKGKK